MKQYPVLLIFLLLFKPIFSQKISISIFNELSLQTILVTPIKGEYKLINGKEEIKLVPNQIVYLSKIGDSILVRDANSNLGTWPRVTIVGSSGEDEIRVKSIMPSYPARLYDDNLSFYVDYKRIMAINLVDQEKYISAVVEAESGPNKDPEFYKAQSLIARTFAIAHLNKHLGEGFNLCDGVHCQAYKGKTGMDKNIYEATLDTKGLVIVDSTNQLITASFYSNCGGWTANSEDVWIKPLPYLKSVEDKYCQGGRNATWEVTIPFNKWKDFLISKGVDSTKITDYNVFEFSPAKRPVYYPIANQKIPVVQIRKHFNLRSAYFSIQVTRHAVRIIGKGYGHGVGLCQEGAMSMAKRGFDYNKIIHFYYHGVKIVTHSEIMTGEPKDSISVDTTLLIMTK